jgi:hypothetical protein
LLKLLFVNAVTGRDDVIITNLNVLIEIIIVDIKSKLESSKTIIIVNATQCVADYNNNYSSVVSANPPLPIRTKSITIPATTLTIRVQDDVVDISNIIRLFTEQSNIIDEMNTFILKYGNKHRSVPESIRQFAEAVGLNIIRKKALKADWTLNIPEFEKAHCERAESGCALCSITTLHLMEAFNDSEYINKVMEFTDAHVDMDKQPALKNNLIAYAIINKLLIISGNKYVDDVQGGGAVDVVTGSPYILNAEYVLSLLLAKNFFKEFHWKNRLTIARQFLDSTMRFYEDTEFIKTIHLINITRKYCSYVFDTYDLISYEPFNTVLEQYINPAIAQILNLYVTQIYLPSFNTVRKIAVSLFPREIVNVLKEDIQSSIPSRRRSSSGSRRSSSFGSRRSSSFGSRSGSSSGSRRGSRRRTKSESFVKSGGLSPSLESISFTVIDSTNSIQESIEIRLDIINQPNEYNIEKAYINFTTDLYSCGEIATVYIDEQFCKIPEYVEMFQTTYVAQLKTQTIIPEKTHAYYFLIPFHPTPDSNQSFIIDKSIGFENIYNLVNLFKLFKHNPLYNEQSTSNDNYQLQMFNLGNKFMLERIGHLMKDHINVEKGLRRIASFIDNIQTIVITYFRQQQLSKISHTPSLFIPKVTSVMAGGSQSLSKPTKDMNQFVLITPDLKLYVITVKTNRQITSNSDSHLSSIEFENTIEIKGCLLHKTDVFAGMIHNDTIPPHTIEVVEVHDFTII